jgi:hypothetical protein
MSRPEHRGRIPFFLVTARPDLVPVDLKRQSRAEEPLALFYPETRDGREELLRVMIRRTGLEDLPAASVPEALLDPDTGTLNGADLEALLTRAKFRAAASGTDAGEAPAVPAEPPGGHRRLCPADLSGRDRTARAGRHVRMHAPLDAAGALPRDGPPRGRPPPPAPEGVERSA